MQINLETVSHAIQTPEPAAAIDLSPMETLAKNAQLVSVTLRMPSFTKLDRSGSADYSRSRNAKQGRHKVSKVLVDSADIVAIRSLGGDVRDIVREACPPYSHGKFLLENESYIDLVNEVTPLFRQMQNHKDNFFREYPSIMAKSQVELGDDYDQNQFPTLTELEYKIGWELNVEPIPLVQDFRGELEVETRKQLEDNYIRQTNNRLRDSLEAVLDNVRKSVTNVSKQLSDKDIAHDPNKKRQSKTTCRPFHGTLLDNVLKHVDMLGICNIHNDPTITNLQDELRGLLDSVNVPQLKASDALRHTTKDKVDAIIQNLPTL